MNALRRTALVLAAATLALWGAGCSETKAARRYSRDEAAKTLAQLEKVGLVIGEFHIKGSDAVIDGDTIRVEGLQNSLRLLCIDTEETFKHKEEREAFAKGWETYKKLMRGDSDHPVKMATPLGEEAKEWARAFFEGVTTVRLERDHPGEIRDYYGRYLAYVMVKKNGEWLNYNLEAVRAGMAPYFTKYGRSRRFDKLFRDAQEKAQEAHVGVWDPKKHGYGDYDERLKWWDGRADVITRFEKQMEEDPEHYIVLTRWDSMQKLEQLLGKEVALLGSVNQIKLGDKGPTIVKLGRNRGNDFDVVFFDKDTFLASGIQQAKGEYVRVKGVVHKYMDPYRQVQKLQVIVSLPGQVLAPAPQLDKQISQSMDDGDGTVSEIKFTTPPPLPAEDEPD